MRASNVFLVLLLLLSTPVASESVVRLTNGEWPPYTSSDLYENGFASHVIREAFAAVDVGVVFGFFPWKRSYLYAEAGGGIEGSVWHGSVVWIKTEERAKRFHYSKQVIRDQAVLFYSRDNPIEWTVVNDLRGKVIGGTLHTAYPIFEEAEKRGLLRIERLGNYETLFKRLVLKRIDAVPQVMRVGEYLLRTGLDAKARSRITFSPNVIEARSYHVIFTKNRDVNRRWLKLFDSGLEKIRRNGKYSEMEADLRRGVYDRLKVDAMIALP